MSSSIFKKSSHDSLNIIQSAAAAKIQYAIGLACTLLSISYFASNQTPQSIITEMRSLIVCSKVISPYLWSKEEMIVLIASPRASQAQNQITLPIKHSCIFYFFKVNQQINHTIKPTKYLAVVANILNRITNSSIYIIYLESSCGISIQKLLFQEV